MKCRARGCGRTAYHMGPCVENPKPGVEYTDGLGGLGCGSWPRDAYGNIVRDLMYSPGDERPDVDTAGSGGDGSDPTGNTQPEQT